MDDHSTEESVNFFRIITMVVDVGSEVLRDVLTTRIPITKLANTFQSNILLLDKLKHSNVLHQDQYDLLITPYPNPEEFDISLLVFLLRNICPNVDPPLGGWTKKQPSVNDFSLGADILRLRHIRNYVYAHRTSTHIREADFERTWEELTNVMLRISKFGSHIKCQEISTKIDDLKTRHFDPSGKVECLNLEKFTKWQDQLDNTIQTTKQEILEHLDSQREKLDKTFEAVKDVQNQVTSTNIELLHWKQQQLEKNGTSAQNGKMKPKLQTWDSQTECNDDISRAATRDENTCKFNYNMCVSLIKLYPWLKDEMEKTSAVYIASRLLSSDHAEAIFNCKQRRMAVDLLLKIVMKNRNIYVHNFFDVLKELFEHKDMLQLKIDLACPTKEEIDAFVRLNDSPPSYSDSNNKSNLCKIEKNVREFLIFHVKDIISIDKLNNCFLSNFFYSLQVHDIICDYLHNDDIPGGARMLMETMEMCPIKIMKTFCDVMVSLGKAYIVQSLDLKERYCKIEKENIGHKERYSYEHGMYAQAVRKLEKVSSYFKNVLGLVVTGLDFGSLIYHLKSEEQTSWKELESKCASGLMSEILETIFVDSEVRSLLTAPGDGLRFAIYAVEADHDDSKAHRTGDLVIDVISGESVSMRGKPHTDTNVQVYNTAMFCDELDVSDDLIYLLKAECLVSDDITTKLKQIFTRSSRIKYLLTHMSSVEKGYKVIKKFLQRSNGYLHDELVKRENERSAKQKRERVFQCEIHFKQKCQDFESRFQFHSMNEFPLPEPLSEMKKTYPSKHRRRNAGTSVTRCYRQPVVCASN